jgi:cyclohexadienyl dehydratase
VGNAKEGNHMKIFGRLLVAAAALLVSALPAAAQQKSMLHQVLERGVLRVGTTGTYFPFSLSDAATQSFQGYDIEVAQQLGKDLGVRVEFVLTTWPTIVAGLVANKYDIAASGITMTLDRMKTVAFTNSYVKPTVVPVIRGADAGKYTTWKDLESPNVTIAVMLGTSAEKTVKETFKQAKIISVEPPAQDWQEVLAGRANAAINDNLSYARVVRRNPTLTMLDPDHPLAASLNGLMTVQGDQVWLNWLNAWIAVHKEDGFFDKLHEKWIVGGGGIR